jgi:hypothetical protein
MSDPELPPPPPPPTGTCPRCNAPVTDDQHWCLNCGHALTSRVAGAPGWRTPIVIVGAVIVLAIAGLLVAFLSLSDEDKTKAVASAATPAQTPVPVTGPSGPTGASPTGASGPSGPSGPTGATPEDEGTPAPDTSIPEPSPTPTSTATKPSSTPSGPSGELAEWPTGKTAFTVIIYSGTTKPLAEAKARSLSSLSELGLLRSRDYSSLRPGYWVVFKGQYDNLAQAQAAAKSVQSDAPGAYAKQVKPK